MRIQHNIMAKNAYRSYSNNVSALSKNLEKLSSGYKINRAGDDAAGLAISEKMRAQVTGLEAAQKNTKDGVSLVKTAEGALSEVHNMLDRMAYLATQSANGTYDDETDRDQLQKEMSQLQDEINRIADSSNFNGIKLLDGSLGGKPNYIKIDGLDTEKINAEIGTTTSKSGVVQALTYNPKQIDYGDTISYSVALDNGKSYTASFTVEKNPDDENGAILVDAATGKKLAVVEDFQPTNGLSADDVGNALVKSMRYTALADDFQITWEDPSFVFKNLVAGDTTVPKVSALDYAVTHDGVETVTADRPEREGAVDEGYGIKFDEITLYDGTNKDDAIFTINGKKFVVMTGNMSGETVNDEYMRAVAALGSDVTVLVTNGDNSNGLKPDDANWEQNIDKIMEVTGLTVEKWASDGSTVDGLKFLLGDGKAAGGLRLQIGDTSASYNFLTVSINDCHTKALGIDTVSVADQEGAASAVDRIRDAINYVSDVRGTLGATQNRLESTQNNLSVMAENIQDAESTIRDTDVAEEMMSYVKNNILVQSAQAMLAQANQVPQGVLQLLG